MKNTMFLYFRMLCVMLVTLYTVRITLGALGINDYGIYQTIGGIVGILAFINGALGTGSSRFLTFELGRGVTEKLKQTFSTLLLAHIIIAIIVAIVAETVGMFYIFHYLNLPDERIASAIIVFQLSVITAIMSMTQIPYTAVIIAHEQLKIYAYISLVEVIFKLGISFAIVALPSHRLEFYALLLCIVQIAVMFLYRMYCYHCYEESHFYRKKFDLSILRSVGVFSGWSIFANLTIALLNQGTLLMLNTFFSPAVVAARVIALQVNSAAQQFMNNFQTAAYPQIVKRYATGDFTGSQKLLLKSANFSYYLMLILAMPIILLADPLLHLWLKNVPDYAVIFLQWSMVQSLFAVFDTSLYYALYAKGQLRENALISPTIGLIVVFVELILFKLGYSPLVMCYLFTLYYAILGIVIKPILACKIANYRSYDIIKMFCKCLLVTIILIPIGYISTLVFNKFTLLGFIEICFTTTMMTIIVVGVIGLNNRERYLICEGLKKKFISK